MLLLQALAELGEIDVHLTLAGDGPMRPLLEAEIERLGLSDRVRITGWIANEEVRRLLIASRAMVLPSFAEGLPLVLMESLALGRPVISTFVAGIPELVRPGRSGWLVPAGSVLALADALRQALSETPERLTQMGSTGAAWVRIHHDARLEAEKLATLFHADAPRIHASTPHEVVMRAPDVSPARSRIGEVRRDSPGGLTPRSPAFAGEPTMTVYGIVAADLPCVRVPPCGAVVGARNALPRGSSAGAPNERIASISVAVRNSGSRP